MNHKNAYIIVFLSLLVIGCSRSPLEDKAGGLGSKRFTNPTYGFSFPYPASWSARTEELPNQMAITDNKQNAVLIMVSDAPSNTTLSEAGILHAQEDTGLSKDRSEEVLKTNFIGTQPWYTYTMQSTEQKLTSVVSGTYCDGIEIRFILVSNIADLQSTSTMHASMLAGFSC